MSASIEIDDNILVNALDEISNDIKILPPLIKTDIGNIYMKYKFLKQCERSLKYTHSPAKKSDDAKTFSPSTPYPSPILSIEERTKFLHSSIETMESISLTDTIMKQWNTHLSSIPEGVRDASLRNINIEDNAQDNSQESKIDDAKIDQESCIFTEMNLGEKSAKSLRDWEKYLFLGWYIHQHILSK